MTKENNVLYASEGMYLTNGNAYGKIVHLGINDYAFNWSEITEEEYQERFSAAIAESEAQAALLNFFE